MKHQEEISDLKQQRDALLKDFNAVGAKLAEQQQINEQLRRSLADTTGHVLTLCKVLGRLV